MTTAPESINIHTDSPINDLREDKFGRASLVELLAKSIQTKCESEHDSLCIGIYGKWGEGKTSFVNMLKQKIKLDNPTLSKAIVDFNPWIINEEKGLIKDFFKTIAGNAEGKLKEYIAKYGGIIAYSAQIVGNVVAPGLGASFKKHVKELNKYILKASETSIEQQKEDISKELVGSKKHLIVFIDDIDRLDCDEIHAVFRLVRQVADFKNTIYVLSLDEERVAKSIGKYFGEGCESDGRQFLEKIVQIPIVLPQIQKNDLKRLLRDHLVEVFNSCKLDVLEVSEILNKIYPLFETYREIIRYRNQLQFFFPLVHTEVNHSDYCILEAIKTLNPKAYNLIRDNKPYMLRRLPMAHDGRMFPDDSVVVEKEYNNLKERLAELFPLSKQDTVRAIMTYYLQETSNDGKKVRLKRLCSEIYFDRYFLQSTPNNFIKDADLDLFNASSVDSIKDWIRSKECFYPDAEISRALLCRFDRDPLKDIIRDNICIAISLSLLAERDSFAAIATEMTKTLLASQNDEHFIKPINVIFSNANLDFALVVLGTLSNKDIERIDGSTFDLLKGRLLEKSPLEIVSYPQFIQEPFFKLWKQLDKVGFMSGIQVVFKHSEFDANKFLDQYLTSEDNQTLANDMDKIVWLFGSSLVWTIDKLDVSVNKFKIFVHNFNKLLEQRRNFSEGDSLYC